MILDTAILEPRQASQISDERKIGLLGLACDCRKSQRPTIFESCLELTQSHEHCLPRSIIQRNRRSIASSGQASGLPVELESVVLELQSGISGRSGVERNAFTAGKTGGIRRNLHGRNRAKAAD